MNGSIQRSVATLVAAFVVVSIVAVGMTGPTLAQSCQNGATDSMPVVDSNTQDIDGNDNDQHSDQIADQANDNDQSVAGGLLAGNQNDQESEQKNDGEQTVEQESDGEHNEQEVEQNVDVTQESTPDGDDGDSSTERRHC